MNHGTLAAFVLNPVKPYGGQAHAVWAKGRTCGKNTSLFPASKPWWCDERCEFLHPVFGKAPYNPQMRKLLYSTKRIGILVFWFKYYLPCCLRHEAALPWNAKFLSKSGVHNRNRLYTLLIHISIPVFYSVYHPRAQASLPRRGTPSHADMCA